MPKTIVLISKYTADISKKSLFQNFSIVQMAKMSFIVYFIGKYEDIFRNNCGIWSIDMNTPQNIYIKQTLQLTLESLKSADF